MIRVRESKSSTKGVSYEVIIKHHGIIIYQKGGFKSKKAATDHEIEKKAELLKTGTIKKEVNKTLNQVFDEFLLIADNEYQENTIYNMKNSKHYFEDTLGKMDIDKISYNEVQNFFNQRKEEGIETNKKIKKALNATFVYAIRSEYITSNPLTYVKLRGKDNSKKKEPIKIEDYLKLVQILNNHGTFLYSAYSVAVQIGFFTGLRISEVAALEKKDFDMENNLINVHHKLVFKGLKRQDYYASENMKSKKSKALLPLPQQLKEILLSWFEKNPFEIVVCTEDGQYINPTSMENALKRITKKMGIDFHYHLLRHTYATVLVNNGVDIKIAQELLRHTNFNTTLSLYTHIENQKKMNVVNTIFNASGVNQVSENSKKEKSSYQDPLDKG